MTSAFVPSAGAPARRTETLASQRRLPSSMLPSLTPMPDEDLAQASEERRRLGGRSEVRLGHDLDERHAGAVEIEVACAVRVGEPFVQRLAGVLFEVDAGDADAPRLASPTRIRRRRRSRAAGRTARSGSPSAGPDRSSSCARRPSARGPCSPARAPARTASSTARRFSTGSAPGSPRQTGQTCVFGGAPKRGAAAAEDLRRGQQLRMDLEADDGFEQHRYGARSTPSPRPGSAAAASVPRPTSRHSASNALKFSPNIRASLRRLLVVGAPSFHVSRGLRTSAGTPGHDCGTSRLKTGSRLVGTRRARPTAPR